MRSCQLTGDEVNAMTYLDCSPKIGNNGQRDVDGQ